MSWTELAAVFAVCFTIVGGVATASWIVSALRNSLDNLSVQLKDLKQSLEKLIIKSDDHGEEIRQTREEQRGVADEIARIKAKMLKEQEA